MVRHLKDVSKDEKTTVAQKIDFAAFWQAYPKKVAKKDALKAWVRIDERAYPKILAAIAAHCQSEQWRKDGGNFIPHPATWLNGERWEDQLEVGLFMGLCSWNINANREGEPRCTEAAVCEKRGLCYCRRHAERVS